MKILFFEFWIFKFEKFEPADLQFNQVYVLSYA